jgi:hypothetical protein
MNDENQNPASHEPAEPTEQAVEKKKRRRPSRSQVLVAAGALVGVLVVGGAGFALGRTTVDDGGTGDRPGHGERFDQRGPGGGPGMMPPALPREEQDVPEAPQAPDESESS